MWYSQFDRAGFGGPHSSVVLPFTPGGAGVNPSSRQVRVGFNLYRQSQSHMGGGTDASDMQTDLLLYFYFIFATYLEHEPLLRGISGFFSSLTFYFVGYCVLNQNRIDFPECKNLPLWKKEPDSGVCSRTEGSAGQVMKVRVTRSLIQQISDWRFHLLQQLQLRLWATENEEK